MKTPLETLKAARDLIKDPARWTQHDYAKDVEGYPTENPAEAVCFCALGAVGKAAGYEDFCDADGSVESEILNACAHDLYGRALVAVNDQLGHDQVLRVFDCAIRKEESAA